MTSLPEYEVLAIKYAEALRKSSDCFLAPDPNNATRMMDYFVWVIRGGGRTVIVDTGFGAAQAAARNRKLVYSLEETFAKLRVDTQLVSDVILTHFHYDHAGRLDLFPSATFHVQAEEMRSATGADVSHKLVNFIYNVEDVVDLVRRNYDGRVRFVRGDAEFAPGISLHLLGGHSRGLQGVRVHTARGWVMLASDALHYYDNLALKNPFPIFVDLPGLIDAGRKALSLAGTGEFLIPGHDPEVMRIFPKYRSLENVVELSVPPTSPAPLS